MRLFLAGTRNQMLSDVFTDRPRMITVSPIPMVTFRVVGLFGKLLAIPFVEPQLD
jgi:hypothetical protein